MTSGNTPHINIFLKLVKRPAYSKTFSSICMKLLGEMIQESEMSFKLCSRLLLLFPKEIIKYILSIR